MERLNLDIFTFDFWRSANRVANTEPVVTRLKRATMNARQWCKPVRFWKPHRFARQVCAFQNILFLKPSITHHLIYV